MASSENAQGPAATSETPSQWTPLAHAYEEIESKGLPSLRKTHTLKDKVVQFQTAGLDDIIKQAKTDDPMEAYLSHFDVIFFSGVVPSEGLTASLRGPDRIKSVKELQRHIRQLLKKMLNTNINALHQKCADCCKDKQMREY
jgi:hypothetical protein